MKLAVSCRLVAVCCARCLPLAKRERLFVFSCERVELSHLSDLQSAHTVCVTVSGERFAVCASALVCAAKRARAKSAPAKCTAREQEQKRRRRRIVSEREAPCGTLTGKEQQRTSEKGKANRELLKRHSARDNKSLDASRQLLKTFPIHPSWLRAS